MSAIEPIKVEGLREFQRALRGLDADLPKALRKALNNAVNIVVDDAKPRIPRRSGRMAASLKAQSSQTKARIKGGGNRAAYFGWIDFGGKRKGRGGGIVTRPFRKSGRYIWKSFGDKREQVISGLEEALVEVAKQAGLEVTHSG